MFKLCGHGWLVQHDVRLLLGFGWGIHPMGSRSRRWLNPSTHSRVGRVRSEAAVRRCTERAGQDRDAYSGTCLKRADQAEDLARNIGRDLAHFRLHERTQDGVADVPAGIDRPGVRLDAEVKQARNEGEALVFRSNDGIEPEIGEAEPVSPNLRCSGLSPTVSDPDAPSTGNLAPFTVTVPPSVSPAMRLMGGEPMKPATNRLDGLR